MLNVNSAIADLQAQWHGLPDFERAQAVLPIVRAGVSRRYLSNVLNVSEGTIRNLLLMLEADFGDLALFRHGEISQNELLRRIRGHRSEPEPRNQQTVRANLPSDPLARRARHFSPIPLFPLIPMRDGRRLPRS